MSAIVVTRACPYRLDGFDIVGHCRSFGLGCERSAALIRHDEVPLGNTLIQLPE